MALLTAFSIVSASLSASSPSVQLDLPAIEYFLQMIVCMGSGSVVSKFAVYPTI